MNYLIRVEQQGEAPCYYQKEVGGQMVVTEEPVDGLLFSDSKEAHEVIDFLKDNYDGIFLLYSLAPLPVKNGIHHTKVVEDIQIPVHEENRPKDVAFAPDVPMEYLTEETDED